MPSKQEPVQLFFELGKLAAGFLTGYFTHFLVIRREANNRRQKAKDEFRAVVADQRAKLDVIDRQEHGEARWQKEKEFHPESINIFIAAVHKMRPFVTEREWLRLDGALKDYQAHKERYVGMTRQGLDTKSGETYAQRLHAYLNRFDAAVAK